VSTSTGKRTLRPLPNKRAAITKRLSGALSWLTKIHAAAVDNKPIPKNQANKFHTRCPRKGCGYKGTRIQSGPKLGALTHKEGGLCARIRTRVSSPSSARICSLKISL